MLKTYGSKTLKEALAPAVALARDGFAVAEFGVYEINETTPEIAAHPALWPEYERVYLAGRKQIALSDVLVQPDLANTLEALGEHGAALLYGGKLGETIIAHLQATGGTLTMDDLRAMRPQWREPMAVSYRGLAVHSLTPPCEAFQLLVAR